MRRLTATATLLLLLAACSADDVTIESTTTSTRPQTTTSEAPQSLSIVSPSFANDEPIPVQFTCDGVDINPQLDIGGLPPSSNLVIVIEDPDAPLGTWIHWLDYNIVAAGPTYEVAENSGPLGVEGVNSWNLSGYGGPCPPPGETHRYIFKVTVLDGLLDLPAGADYEAVMQAMNGNVISEAELRGVYGR